MVLEVRRLRAITEGVISGIACGAAIGGMYAIQYDGVIRIRNFPIGAVYGAAIGAGPGLVAGICVALAMSGLIKFKVGRGDRAMSHRYLQLISGAAAAVSIMVLWILYLAQSDVVQYLDAPLVALIIGSVVLTALIAGARGHRYVSLRSS